MDPAGICPRCFAARAAQATYCPRCGLNFSGQYPLNWRSASRRRGRGGLVRLIVFLLLFYFLMNLVAHRTPRNRLHLPPPPPRVDTNFFQPLH